MLDSLDATAIRQWCAAGLTGLRRHQAEIDGLNVFPVSDRDTGTNLVLTMQAAWQALEQTEAQPGTQAAPVLLRMARGALLEARGNSGVIVAQLLHAMADAVGSVGEAAVRGRALAEALTAAAKAAYSAVGEPVEGTLLTVATAAARAARASDSDDLPTVARAAAQGASAALIRTQYQLPVLTQAGVVDAGGRGLVVLLDALVDVVTGRAIDDPVPVAQPAQAGLGHFSGGYGYEVQYLLEAPSDAVEVLRRELAGLGDSLAIVGWASESDRPLWNVHVHVDDVGAAIEAGINAGRPSRIAVTRFADQVPGPMVPAAQVSGPPASEHAGGLVVVALGDGLVETFAGTGAVVVTGGPAQCPSIEDVLDAVRSTGAGRVVVFPNDREVLAVAQQAAEAARDEGIRVGVVPTRSPVQAIAAIAVHDASKHFHDDMVAMAEAAGACRYAEVTVATREALTTAGRCHPGDVLGLVEGDVNVIGQDLGETCRLLLDRLLGGGGEVVTLVWGATVPTELGAVLGAHLARQWPLVEVRVLHGGQPDYPLLVGVE